MITPQQLEGVVDLSTLPQLSDDLITKCLNERFLSNHVYTRIGSSALVALNPFKDIPLNADASMEKYCTSYESPSQRQATLPPHVFQLALNAYYNMRRTKLNQCIFFSGIMGSGKSESRLLATRAILGVSICNPGKDSKLSTQVHASESILEAFGNARTEQNPNASRFCKYAELQFSESGALCGVKTVNCFLERNRVAGAPARERNFRIFYYLLAGASPKESQYLHLIRKTSFRLLDQQGTRGHLRNDRSRLDHLKSSFKTIGFSRHHVAQIFQLVAAVLHLGNLDFTFDQQRDADAAVVRNMDTLELVASFLGVQSSDLESALCSRTRFVKNELCTFLLDPAGAASNRDDLAITLYSLLFSWLNDSINQRLCSDSYSTCISVLDFPGSQNMTGQLNSLDQFCFNFANERLQNWIQTSLFSSHSDEYQMEGISSLVPQVQYKDNSDCVQLLGSKPHGLIYTMSDQSRHRTTTGDWGLFKAFQRRWNNHPSFEAKNVDRSDPPAFTIHHFSAPVTYSAVQFLDRNLDVSNQDFVSLLHNSTNSFIKDLFSVATTVTPGHSLSQVAVTRPKATPKATPSQRISPSERKPTSRGHADSDTGEDRLPSNRRPYVAEQLDVTLDALFGTLGATQAWYVFCVKPNDSLLANQLDIQSVKNQGKHFGLTGVAKRCVRVFEVDMTLEMFCEKYRLLIETRGVGEDEARKRIQHVRTSLDLSDEDIVLGLNKVFLSQVAFHKLEDSLRDRDIEERNGSSQRAVLNNVLDVLHQADSDESCGVRYQALPAALRHSPPPQSSASEKRLLQSDGTDARNTPINMSGDEKPNFDSDAYTLDDMFQGMDDKTVDTESQHEEAVEEIKTSPARKMWVIFCWILTFWLPNPCLKYIGRMKLPSVRQAWREKLALNMLIWLLCAGAMFVIIFLGSVVCPKTKEVLHELQSPLHSSALQSNQMLGRYVFGPAERHDVTVISFDRQVQSQDLALPFRKLGSGKSSRCQFQKYLLLTLSSCVLSLMGFKCLSAMCFGKEVEVEVHDKFIICQVPCYTEGEASLRQTINSLAETKYDDKRKLLLVVCDGMIVGSGNDRPTPRIVLDILGSDPTLDPQPLSFLSLGDGAKQHNMGKVYSGLYESSGHIVPYLVVVKLGKPTELYRAGNRGKRDTQLMVMNFLNKVHFNTPMCPLELEMHHQIRNVIGINPTFYEYLLIIDADTTLEPTSINRLVSAMMRDNKVLGISGDIALSNADKSFVTMIQVYEYYIWHQITKTFESSFGSVTCLSGCFTLYRLRTPDTHQPLLISNKVVEDYSENRVDTLHLKNLLNLGEDRYLTTLLLKHFPSFKTKYVREARALTVAPERWSVLLSQRRRWTNSAVHNLIELILIDHLCGFCCFSMRFAILLDLISTLTQPVNVVYIVYLIYLVARGGANATEQLALIMIAAVYGLELLVLVLQRRLEMIGWMIIYILAMPLHSFLVPLYSFWRMDDFSWGATRVVLVERGQRKTLLAADESEFDPHWIPRKTWTDYQKDIWGEIPSYDAEPQISPVERSKTYVPSHAAPISPADVGKLETQSLSVPPTQTSEIHRVAARDPTDSELEEVIQHIMDTADLDRLTKRQVRQQLEENFGVDLSTRRDMINTTIDKLLC